MLNKMVNGQEVICSDEEEASIRAFWAASKARISIQRENRKKRKENVEVIGDIPDFLYKLCRKLGLDPKQKNSW